MCNELQTSVRSGPAHRPPSATIMATSPMKVPSRKHGVAYLNKSKWNSIIFCPRIWRRAKSWAWNVWLQCHCHETEAHHQLLIEPTIVIQCPKRDGEDDNWEGAFHLPPSVLSTRDAHASPKRQWNEPEQFRHIIFQQSDSLGLPVSIYYPISAIRSVTSMFQSIRIEIEFLINWRFTWVGWENRAWIRRFSINGNFVQSKAASWCTLALHTASLATLQVDKELIGLMLVAAFKELLAIKMGDKQVEELDCMIKNGTIKDRMPSNELEFHSVGRAKSRRIFLW